jgi:DNA-binding NarL/FixJ family response regulator
MENDHTGPARAIRVLVADNSRFHTQLLSEALKRDPDLQIFSSDLDAASLVAASVNQRIDVFALSAFAEEDAQRGFRILKELRETNPHTRAVMLLDSSKPDSVVEAFRSGARGIIDHHESLDMLSRCIRRIHEGQVWASHEQMTLMIEALASTPRVRFVNGNGMNLLCKREVEVVRYVAEGLTNREIAQRMGLSQHTIKNYLFHIFDKLGVSSRIELLFMSLSQSAPPAPALIQGLLNDPVEGCDEATLALCHKAAEHGVVAAQLALARMFWTGRPNDSDVVGSYVWYSVALDQLTASRNAVKKALTPAQLAEAERQVRDRLDKSRGVKTHHSSETPLLFEHRAGA